MMLRGCCLPVLQIKISLKVQFHCNQAWSCLYVLGYSNLHTQPKVKFDPNLQLNLNYSVQSTTRRIWLAGNLENLAVVLQSALTSMFRASPRYSFVRHRIFTLRGWLAGWRRERAKVPQIKHLKGAREAGAGGAHRLFLNVEMGEGRWWLTHGRYDRGE